MLQLMEEGQKVMSGLLERVDGKTGPYQRRQRNDGRRQAVLRDRAALDGGARPSWSRRRAPCSATTCNSSRNTAQRAMGGEALPVAEPEPGDNRFNDPEWSRNPYFDFWKQSYLITTRWLEDLLDRTEGLDERTRQRAEFYLKQIVGRAVALQFPADQSRGDARDVSSRAGRTSCRAWPTSCTTWRGPATCSTSARPMWRPSRSAATSRPRPARSSSRTTSSSSSSTRPRPRRCTSGRC